MGRLGPNDLPEDPFGAGGMAQLFCACTGELFKFVFTETTVRAICAQCGQPAGEYPRTSSPVTIEQAMVEGHPLPPVGEQIGPGRDMLGGSASPHVGAAWDMPPPGTPDTNPVLAPGQAPPPLPAFSPGMCNVFLRGGAYDGQLTALVPGTSEFIIGGVGVYTITEEVHEGRIVYQHRE